MRGQASDVAKWMDSVAPSIVGSTQIPEVTELVVDHLRSQRVSDATIAAALALSGYEWSLSVRGDFLGITTRMRVARLQQANSAKHQTMAGAKRPDREWMRQEAERLDTLYGANAHNPELRKQLIRAFIDLLGQAGEAFHDMQKDKERIEEVQREILRNSRNIAPIVRHLGPLALHRLRQHPTPSPRGTPYFPPRTPTRGR